MLYFPHYFPFFISIFSSFLFLFVLWWYYTRSGTIKRLRIRKCIKRNWDTIIHSKCFIFSKIRSDEAHYPTTNFISSTLLSTQMYFLHYYMALSIFHFEYQYSSVIRMLNLNNEISFLLMILSFVCFCWWHLWYLKRLFYCQKRKQLYSFFHNIHIASN